jgi:hypothetical protein
MEYKIDDCHHYLNNKIEQMIQDNISNYKRPIKTNNEKRLGIFSVYSKSNSNLQLPKVINSSYGESYPLHITESFPNLSVVGD